MAENNADLSARLGRIIRRKESVKMADYGRVEFGGNWYALTQDAWYSWTDTCENVWYEAAAVAENGDIYRVLWIATHPEAENEDEVCDWNEPYDVMLIEEADEEE